MRAISLKVEERQLRLLEHLSQATRIPKSALIRKGIELVLQQAKDDVLSAEFRREVDAVLQDDETLLKRLAKA